MTTVKYLSIPPFRFKITSNNRYFLTNLEAIYQGALSDTPVVCDYHVALMQTSGIRQLVKPQVSFYFDNYEPFKPLPENHGFAMFEWGLNWVVATNEFQHLFIHSAVLAKDSKAILFPAEPGSGKSTLTCYLAAQGWQLLSDEMAILEPNSDIVTPFVRPICLKNNSIDLAKAWYDDAAFSTVARQTHKGDVAHLRPPEASIADNQKQARIRALVFPKYKKGSETLIYQLNQAQAFSNLTEHCFNYSVLGQEAFATMTALVERVDSYEVIYSDLADLQDFLEEDLL